MIVFLDLDRTIFNTNLFFADIMQATEDLYGAKQRAVIQAKLDETYRQTGAASLLGAGMTTQDLNATAARVEDTVIKNQPRRYWYDDVSGFLKRLKQNGQMAMVLTSGRKTTQELKLRLAGLNLKYIVVSEPQKSHWIADNYLFGEEYIVDGCKYSHLELYDDSISNFDAFDTLPNAKGYLVLRGDNIKPAPKVVPKSVVLVKTLDQ
jgi:hypothetical protein